MFTQDKKLWRGENNADVDGVMATEAEPLIVVAVVEVVEVVGGAEDTGTKIMWRDTKQMPTLPLMMCNLVRPIPLTILKLHRRRRSHR